MNIYETNHASQGTLATHTDSDSSASDLEKQADSSRDRLLRTVDELDSRKHAVQSFVKKGKYSIPIALAAAGVVVGGVIVGRRIMANRRKNAAERLMHSFMKSAPVEGLRSASMGTMLKYAGIAAATLAVGTAGVYGVRQLTGMKKGQKKGSNGAAAKVSQRVPVSKKAGSKTTKSTNR